MRVAGRDRARARFRAGHCARPPAVHAELRAARGVSLGARARACCVTVDNLYVLREWARLFAGREILRAPRRGRGHGHHEKVRTGRLHSKFGVPPFELAELPACARSRLARRSRAFTRTPAAATSIVGGWVEPARGARRSGAAISGRRASLNLGGGLGVAGPAGPAPAGPATNSTRRSGRFGARMPYFAAVARAGPIPGRSRRRPARARDADQGQGRSTLRRRRDRHEFPDPAGALWRVSRDRQPDAARRAGDRMRCTVVGPICESGDVLGEDRLLPRSDEGDVLLIANTGAYGHAMSVALQPARACAGAVVVPDERGPAARTSAGSC